MHARVGGSGVHDCLLQAQGPRPALAALWVRLALLLVRGRIGPHPVRVEVILHDRHDRQQLDAAHDVRGSPKPSLMLHDVVPQDPHDLVGEVLPVDAGRLAHVPVGVGTVGLHGREQPSEVLEVRGERRVHGGAVRVDGVVAVDGLAGALLVPAVLVGLRDAPRPRGPQEPVLVPGDREARVLRGRVRVVAHDREDLLPPLLLPRGRVLGRHGRAVHVVAVVEVVVVIIGVAEVHAGRREGGAVRRGLLVIGAVGVALAAAIVV
mmetsp:Transcript_1817/g.5129  ORF Transcript_1817/g.5129 Transcript_1817/m.5129 type:complete len:264 (+) Transcript_1817:1742-2533(+)